MIYNNRNGELSILAHHMNAFYELKYDAANDKTVIEVYGDKASDDWSADYEVALLCPNSRQDHGRFDCCVVLDEEQNIVAFSEGSDWVVAFIDGNDAEEDLKVYEKYFATIIRQLHTGVVDHVGQ